MPEFLAFAQLGLRHIVGFDAADHVLFLLVLAAIYRGSDWRAALWTISAFTVGHSLTLALAVTDAIAIPPAWIEFLIPVTIAATGIENLVLREHAARGRSARHRPLLAGVFGLVHGAGFAGYLKSLFVEHLAVPLLGFNVGIEVGQLLVLTLAATAFWGMDRALARVPGLGAQPGPFALRLVSVSLLVTVVAIGWSWERLP